MKTPSTFRLLLLIVIGSFLTIWGCRREVEVVLPALPKIVGKPSAATTGCMYVGAPGAATLTMRLDIYAVDQNGRQIRGLNRDNFTIAPGSGRTFQIQNLASAALTNKAGGYSAMMLLDQSSSIIGNDPQNLRISGSKIFMDYMGSNDVVALSSFPGSRSTLRVHSPFMRETAVMKRSLDSLADTESGGTPLYEATLLATDYTVANAPTANKAVIVFTDGQGSGNVDACITNAQQKGIPLFTIGLTNGVNVEVLSRMASETCGAFFFAKDAQQLVTSFGTLGNLLHGTAQVYRTDWSITRSNATWRTGDVVTSTVKITIPNNDPIEVPFWVKVK